MNRTSIAVVAAVTLAAAGVAHGQTPMPDAATPNSAPSSGGTAANEAAVKEQIRAAGFTGVHSLTRNPDGTWEGRARKDDTNVAVMVDTAGNVMVFQ